MVKGAKTRVKRAQRGFYVHHFTPLAMRQMFVFVVEGLYLTPFLNPVGVAHASRTNKRRSSNSNTSRTMVSLL